MLFELFSSLSTKKLHRPQPRPPLCRRAGPGPAFPSVRREMTPVFCSRAAKGETKKQLKNVKNDLVNPHKWKRFHLLGVYENGKLTGHFPLLWQNIVYIYAKIQYNTSIGYPSITGAVGEKGRPFIISTHGGNDTPLATSGIRRLSI